MTPHLHLSTGVVKLRRMSDEHRKAQQVRPHPRGDPRGGARAASPPRATSATTVRDIAAKADDRPGDDHPLLRQQGRRSSPAPRSSTCGCRTWRSIDRAELGPVLVRHFLEHLGGAGGQRGHGGAAALGRLERGRRRAAAGGFRRAGAAGGRAGGRPTTPAARAGLVGEPAARPRASAATCWSCRRSWGFPARRIVRDVGATIQRYLVG